ncbi:MAG: hypothetical protein IH993_06310, partial [Proteobacteria bacterium]|nr:hypothetical protein [Pseudomonadota bacterium]
MNTPKAFIIGATIVLGVSCWPTAGWTQTAISGEARNMSSNAAATGGLIEALAGHVHELSAKIGERSVLRGDGLDRAKAYVRGAFEAAGLTVTEQAYEYDGRRVANLIADPPGAATDAAP